MNILGLGRSVTLGALLASGALLPGRAHAADDGCSLIGMFDSRAKALCEQMRRSKQDRPQSQEISGRDRADGYSDEDNPLLTPPVAPARGFHRYEIAKAGLFVDFPGAYPQGYGPLWKLNAKTPQPIIMDRYNLLNRGPQGTETLFVRIAEDQGRAVLEFARRGTPACHADIVGLQQVITETPKRFRLANFRYANNLAPQCQRKLGSTAPWQGFVTLSADQDGNIELSLTLDLAMDSGQPWFEFTARNLPFANQMTPQMASADISQKQQAAVANAERERQAVAAHAEAVARINALPVAGSVYARQMAGYIQTDSLGWAMNRLDARSVHNVRIYSGSVKSGDFVLRAEYTYNGGSSGWAVAKYEKGSFSCIQFFDGMIGCRPLRRPGQGQATMASILESGMNGSNSQGSNQGPDENTRFNMWRQNNIAQGLNDNGTPK